MAIGEWRLNCYLFIIGDCIIVLLDADVLLNDFNSSDMLSCYSNVELQRASFFKVYYGIIDFHLAQQIQHVSAMM